MIGLTHWQGLYRGPLLKQDLFYIGLTSELPARSGYAIDPFMVFSMKSRKTLLESPRFCVDQVESLSRSGQNVSRLMIDHPGAAVILPVYDDEHLVLIRNYRFAIDQTLLELPAGSLEPGEDPRVCAHRELIEETGYRASHLEPFVNFYPSAGISTEKMFVFIATGLVEEEQNLDDTEEIQVEIVAMKNLWNQIIEGKVSDGKILSVFPLWYSMNRR